MRIIVPLSAVILGGAAMSLYFLNAPETEGLDPDARATRTEVRKNDRALALYDGDAVLKTYRVALGFNPLGHKEREGDGRTPEGTYVIDWRNPASAYHLSMHISYPDAEDRARAAERGVSPGGDVMIHGLSDKMAIVGAAHAKVDWTAGCIAVTNDEMDEIWRAVPNGTPITIHP